MVKKQTGSAKPKKLRLVTNLPIGLTDSQQKELTELFRPLSWLGHSAVSDRDLAKLRSTSFDRMLYIYVEALCHDARVENSNSRTRRTTAMRRRILKELGKLGRREFTPDDLIKKLSGHSPVPKFAADAIRRDYLRLTV